MEQEAHMVEQQRHSGDFFKQKRIGVLLGGLSPESDVSRRSGSAMAAALQRLGYTVTRIEADRSLAGELERNRIEIAMLALHGSFGEDGIVQGLLELMGIPYTGSGVLASAVAMHKALSKKIFVFHELPTPAFQVLSSPDNDTESAFAHVTMKPPFVVKPCEGGSSIGISIVREKTGISAALRSAVCDGSGDILIEAYVGGREVTVGVLNGRALPAIEVSPSAGFYDYDAKYNSKGETSYIDRPDLPAGLHEQLQDLAETVYRVLGCAGAARVDFIVNSEGQPFILEINTIPGMTETSLLPMAARQAGISFDELVERILHGATLHKIVERRAI
jgi:D-alanine-D-alanine ligase